VAVYVYMLRCSDGSYYVGSTRASLEHRVAEHNAGIYGGYTAKRRPVTLVWQQEFQRATDAIAAERQVKGWRREKKVALIRGDFTTLRRLASRAKAPPRLAISRSSPFETSRALMLRSEASRSRGRGVPQGEDRGRDEANFQSGAPTRKGEGAA
jgi:putative endonuclease